MYYTYVLQSSKDSQFYTGFTKDLKLFNRVNLDRALASGREIMVFALDLELRVSIRVFCVDPCPKVFGGRVMGSKKAHSDTAHSWKARRRGSGNITE